jgi:LAO/AO transport system kinase
MVNEYVTFTKQNSFFSYKRNDQSKYWMYESINEQLRNHFYQSPKIKKELAVKESQVLRSEMSSFQAARQMLAMYFKESKQ